jgi:hypothetical protein
VSFVHETQKVAVQYLKRNFPAVKSVVYFSDGCSAQYKNCKNFLNLCLNKKYFDLEAKWCFFATSHRKSPCDGIGGTVKRTVTKASLQRSPVNPIDNAEKLFDFCNRKIENINFILIKKQTTIRHGKNWRIASLKQRPGTRSFHHFEPISEESIATKV